MHVTNCQNENIILILCSCVYACVCVWNREIAYTMKLWSQRMGFCIFVNFKSYRIIRNSHLKNKNSKNS